MERIKPKTDKDQFIEDTQRYFTPGDLKLICLNLFGQTEESCIGAFREVVFTKQFIVRTIKYFYPDITLFKLSEYVDTTNHATILHSLNKINTQIELEERLHDKKYTNAWKSILHTIREQIVQKQCAEQKWVYQFAEAVTNL